MATHTETHTLDGISDGWSSSTSGRRDGRPFPRLRILYHVDLDRIGDLTEPEAFPTDERAALLVGRLEPLFRAPAGDQRQLSIEDPAVSRRQARIRWLVRDQCFEVTPDPDAKRLVSVVDPARRQDEAVEVLTGPARVAPGSCLAFGDRTLVALEVATLRPGADRLGLVGESELLWQLRDDVVAVAGFDGPTLLTGPTGTGKELVARAIHASGARARGPFVPVNCGALPERLAESLFFGHRKGAFTGADHDEPGLFLAAHGGSLFLDELGELPPSVQPKLLRVLQDGQVVAVGGHRARQCDARLIAATNRDPITEVTAGRLREDLYHRLAGHRLRVPALDLRRLDVPELFMCFLRRLRERHADLAWLWSGARQWRPTIPIRFFASLMRRSWSGNVRELQHYAERVARATMQAGVFAEPDDDVGHSATGPVSEPLIEVSAATAEVTALLGLAHKTVVKLLPPTALAELHTRRGEGSDADHADRIRAAVAEALYRQLEAVGFNRTRAASEAGLSRTTLGKLLSDFGIKRPAELTEEEIATASLANGGDVAATARALQVSAGGLGKHLTLLNLRRRRIAE
ncbi:MAG: hypothetical protein AMXMBFR64_55360 [Myxococcales bacterium]